jgi:hypothetical protein
LLFFFLIFFFIFMIFFFNYWLINLFLFLFINLFLHFLLFIFIFILLIILIFLSLFLFLLLFLSFPPDSFFLQPFKPIQLLFFLKIYFFHSILFLQLKIKSLSRFIIITNIKSVF